MSDHLLLIPHIKIQNANALSSPFTIGFPAMTGWLGAVHALQRRLNESGLDVAFEATGVVSHQFNLQTYKGPGDYVHSIIGTANPLDKDGSRSAFIEEARCHLEVSLVLQCRGVSKLQEGHLIDQIEQLLPQMKMAGGDILGFDQPSFHREFDRLKYKLMPGYAIIERRDLMREAMEDGQDAMDALLDYLAIHHSCQQIEGKDGDKTITWTSQRKRTGGLDERGWIVPIATGFQRISELGKAKNQRDQGVEHCFAESVVTLGEFKMPYKMDSTEELLWQSFHEPENQLYLCQQITTEYSGF